MCRSCPDPGDGRGTELRLSDAVRRGLHRRDCARRYHGVGRAWSMRAASAAGPCQFR